MPETTQDRLEELWPLGVRVGDNGVTLLDENGNNFASVMSRIPGSKTGQAGAVGRLLATLEAAEDARNKRRARTGAA